MGIYTYKYSLQKTSAGAARLTARAVCVRHQPPSGALCPAVTACRQQLALLDRAKETPVEVLSRRHPAPESC